MGILSNKIDFEKLSGSKIRVYGLAYTGNIIIKTGSSVRDSAITDDCFDLSDNFSVAYNFSVKLLSYAAHTCYNKLIIRK